MAENDDKDKGSLGIDAVGTIMAYTPGLKRKMQIWAVRSVIVVAVAYGVVALNGPDWLVPVAWVYVAITFFTSLALGYKAEKAASGKS